MSDVVEMMQTVDRLRTEVAAMRQEMRDLAAAVDAYVNSRRRGAVGRHEARPTRP